MIEVGAPERAAAAIAPKNADGHHALRQYACGIEGLASGGCYSTIQPTQVIGGIETPVTAEAVPARP